MTGARRSAAAGVTALVAAAGLLATSGPTRADDTGISGGVESVVELSLETSASGSVTATVTATVPHTRLDVTARGTDRTVDELDGPVTGERQTVRVDAPKGGDITFTYGPQGP